MRFVISLILVLCAAAALVFAWFHLKDTVNRPSPSPSLAGDRPEASPFPTMTPAANTITRPTKEELLEETLRSAANRYSSEIGFLRAKGGGPGYHTRTTKDQTVHHVLDTANYAQLLLMRGLPEDVARASDILARLVDLQVTDPASKHYGLWGWFVEEPPDQMAPADWNWADFVGARLAEILKAYAGELDPGLVARLKESLGHAARCIEKRNVGPSYTNICTMGAGVTMAAGEILGDPELVEYGRRRLAAQREELERNGGVPEYNSPDYGIVMMQELERILRLVEDPAARADAEWMRQRMWRLTAGQFHPGTGQWAGAQSRSYSGTLRGTQALYLWQRAGVVPPNAAATKFTPWADLLHDEPALACPPDAAERFARLPSSPLEAEQNWMEARPGTPPVVLHTWFSDDATLGTINEETTWVQHRVLTGFWAAADGGIASARLNLLKDGKEFASGLVRMQQDGPRVLAVAGLASGQGDWHVSLDRPKDGHFTASDLRLRVLLDAPDAKLTPRSDGGWILSAGNHELVIHPGEILFDGRPGRWEAGEHKGGVHVDAILYEGAPLRFAPAGLAETGLALGLELLPVGQRATSSPLTSTLDGALRRWQWAAVKGDLAAPAPTETP
jgi:hypothetical protein